MPVPRSVLCFALAPLAGCANFFEAPYALLGPCDWNALGDVPADVPWRGGATPEEHAAEIDGVTGTWESSGGLIAAFEVTAELNGTPSVWNALNDEGEACREDALFLPLQLAFTATDGTWLFEGPGFVEYLADEDLLNFNGRTENPSASLVILPATTALAEDTPISDLVAAACSADFALALRGPLASSLEANLQATCPDGTVETVAGGYWELTP